MISINYEFPEIQDVRWETTPRQCPRALMVDKVGHEFTVTGSHRKAEGAVWIGLTHSKVTAETPEGTVEYPPLDYLFGEGDASEHTVVQATSQVLLTADGGVEIMSLARAFLSGLLPEHTKCVVQGALGTGVVIEATDGNMLRIDRTADSREILGFVRQGDKHIAPLYAASGVVVDNSAVFDLAGVESLIAALSYVLKTQQMSSQGPADIDSIADSELLKKCLAKHTESPRRS